MTWELIHADNRAVMANMGDNTVDAVVTDGPYELVSIRKRFGGANSAPQQFGTDGAYARAARGFMGQTWDGTGIVNDPTFWAEVLRVLKPGGFLLSFGGTRTYHRMACAVEDAGFEIRDMLEWIYGSGFPKSHDVSKALDKMAGAEREVVGQSPWNARKPNGSAGVNSIGLNASAGAPDITAPATDAARQWDGWGTALKPAHEPICMARKPFPGSVAANVLEWGTGAINIDGCRIETTDGYTENRVTQGVNTAQTSYAPAAVRRTFEPASAGRFPANICHDGSPEVLAGFPETKSTPPGNIKPTPSTGDVYGAYAERSLVGHTDSGSAARFFYCAKASKRDRDEGCEHLAPADTPGVLRLRSDAHSIRNDEATAPRTNHHPTVKPEALMRWLVRMVTPPGGVVFDPFTGSGSTGKAAMLEGVRFIGAEMTDEYIPVARARIEHARLTAGSN